MRHDNIEHRQCKPVPFTVKGDLKSVLRALGLPDGMEADEAKDIFCGDAVCVRVATGEPCVITTWECVKGDGPAYYTVNARPVRMVSKPATPIDPWIIVGTTTIDGSLAQVGEMLRVLRAESHLDAIDTFLQADEPWLIGGRYLQAKRSHINEHAGTALIRCDIVRRLSECCVYCDRDHLTDAQRERAPECSACNASIAAKMSQRPDVRAIAEKHGLKYREHVCPECGPHGNRGEVLLASSWAKCTTCAGGKPGDLWGEVKASEEPRFWSSVANKMVTVAEALALGRSLRRPEDEVFDEVVEVKRGPATTQGALSSALIAEGASSEVAQAGVRAFLDALAKPPSFPTPATAENLMKFEIASGIRAPDGQSFMDARREALAAQHGQGFKVPTLSEMHGEPRYWSSAAGKMVTFAEALALGRSLRPIEDA